MKICKHCQKNKVNRPRGLCWSCYYTPGVREQHPSTSKYARRGNGNFTGNAPLPVAPTLALPGTEEKIAILAERVKRGESLWHPSDAGVPMPPAERVEVGTEMPTLAKAS